MWNNWCDGIVQQRRVSRRDCEQRRRANDVRAYRLVRPTIVLAHKDGLGSCLLRCAHDTGTRASRTGRRGARHRPDPADAARGTVLRQGPSRDSHSRRPGSFACGRFAMRAANMRRGRRRKGRSLWHWLLLPLAVLPLASLWYDRIEPRLFGFPFFYWGQLGLILVVWFGTLAVHLLSRRAVR